MILISFDRVIINRMVLVNKYDYDGFDVVYIYNK